MNEDVAILPEGSVAVYVTTVLPIGKETLGSWLDVNVTESELSFAVGSIHDIMAVAWFVSVTWVILDGRLEITGFAESVETRHEWL